jgi:hypothetical protein
MYDADRSPSPWDPPWPDHAPGVDPALRLTHLVLVDGRLVDVWSEPVEETRWQHHAARFDRERGPVPEPPPPPWQRALDWLADVCGGSAAVAALDADPLDDDDLALPDVPDRHQLARLEATADLLDAVAGRLLDAEAGCALRRALLRVWAEEAEVVLRPTTAGHVAGGVCWAVGKANGWFRPQGDLAMGRVQEALALGSSPSGSGQRVRSALRGFRDLPAAGWRYGVPGVPGVPDLEALGHADLLVSTTRARLVRLRDRAVAARDAAA